MEEEMRTFEDRYAGYVIRVDGHYFVGPSSEMALVALRSMAARFTKAGAMRFIQDTPEGIVPPSFMGTQSAWSIEDA